MLNGVPRVTMAFESGSRIGKYEITAPLVGFGIGEAYSAVDIRLGREVAVKVYRIPPDSDDLRRLEEKMSRSITLYHANIGTILEFDVGGDFPYAVMEIFEGESLRVRLARGPLPWRECVMIGSDIALGLAAAHEKGTVHGNLVPASIFLGSDGRVRRRVHIWDTRRPRSEVCVSRPSAGGPSGAR